MDSIDLNNIDTVLEEHTVLYYSKTVEQIQDFEVKLQPYTSRAISVPKHCYFSDTVIFLVFFG